MSKVNTVSGYETIPPMANNYPLKIRRYAGDIKLVPHWHEHLELVYLTKGSCSFMISGKQYAASRGDLIVVNGREVHSYTAGTDIEYYCILLYPDFFRDVDFSGIMIQNLISGDAEAAEWIEEMFGEYERGGTGSDMMQKALAYRLMSHLTVSYATERLSERSRALQGAALGRLDKVLELVAENYGRHISTRELAAACYLSEGHFCRFFKSATGKSALEYISEYRAERAAVLLENTELSLGEVAGSVGFEDVNYFCRMFKRAKGISPARYRAVRRESEKKQI